MKITLLQIYNLMRNFRQSLTTAVGNLETAAIAVVRDERKYLVSYYEVFSWKGFVKRTRSPLVVVANTYGDEVSAKDIEWLMESRDNSNDEQYVLVADRNTIMSKIAGLTDCDFDNARSIDYLRCIEVGEFVGKLTKEIPHPQSLFEFFLKAKIQEGLTHFKDISIVDTEKEVMGHRGVEKVTIKAETSPRDFLEYYVRKLQTLRNSGVGLEVLDQATYARLFLREMLNQRLSIVMMMEREDIHELAGRLFRTHITAPIATETLSECIDKEQQQNAALGIGDSKLIARTTSFA